MAAARALKDRIIRTPLVFSPTFSDMFGCSVYLKLENLQKTGSFKVRGAMNRIIAGRAAIGPGGVVAASAGNHAQGVALAARSAGVPATLIMPEWASISKQEATRSYGGRVVLSGNSIDRCLQEAQRHVERGKTLIHPFDDPDVMAGQGTVALEVLEDLDSPDVVVVPIGGGGLISGIGSVVKAIRPSVKIIGVQAESCPSAYESRKAGVLKKVTAVASIADGISVKQPGRRTFDIIQEVVDDIVLVSEEEISEAVLLLLERKKILAEGAGAVPLAALRSGAVDVPAGGRVVLVISGGNVDMPLLGRILRRGMVKNGRIMRLRFQMEDIPGVLASLLALIAGLKANVLHIYHDRYVRDLPVRVTRVELELETRGPEHIAEIAAALTGGGYLFEIL